MVWATDGLGHRMVWAIGWSGPSDGLGHGMVGASHQGAHVVVGSADARHLEHPEALPACCCCCCCCCCSCYLCCYCYYYFYYYYYHSNYCYYSKDYSYHYYCGVSCLRSLRSLPDAARTRMREYARARSLRQRLRCTRASGECDGRAPCLRTNASEKR